MDDYPRAYVEHNLPLVIVSGLVADDLLDDRHGVEATDKLVQRGFPIRSKFPPVAGDRAEQLLQEFMSVDGRDAPWNSATRNSKGGLHNFRIRAVGRVGMPQYNS
jgi:trafficking protein particle complex subunit 11